LAKHTRWWASRLMAGKRRHPPSRGMRRRCLHPRMRNRIPRMDRQPNSLPDPNRPAGTGHHPLPLDHLVVLMMEKHPLDNLLGELPRSGQPAADGLTFDSDGRATNTNPGTAATPPEVRAFPFSSTAQGTHVSQTWNATHEQIAGGRMDGFVRSVNATQ